MKDVVFTTEQADGALPNGTRIAKTASAPGDGNPDGALGKVLGSISDGKIFGYFVEWDAYPGVPCFVSDYRLKEVGAKGLS